MIKRYSRVEMAQIWEDRSKFLQWLKVETVVCEHMITAGILPKNEGKQLIIKLKKIITEGGVHEKEVFEIEQKTKHDFIAFTTAIANRVGPSSRFVHYGLTSSDVIDTGFALQLLEAGQIIVKELNYLIQALFDRAKEFKTLPTLGRSHGIYAEPTSFGLKFLGFAMEFTRDLERFKRALADTQFGKLSGAVGVGSHWEVSDEVIMLKKLGLKREWVSTQVIPRDRHAHLLQVMGLIGGAIERIAIEFRHLQRTEVGELREGFGDKQKGSSAMPHKRNPISSENLTGCARLLKSYSSTGLENIALWHERDMSHSSVERVVFPDSFLLLDYSINRLRKIIENLEVDEKAIRSRVIKAGGLVYSGHFLLKLVERGATRENAYRWIQRNALKSLDSKVDFLSLLMKDKRVLKYLKSEDIKKIGSVEFQLRNVDAIFREVLKEYELINKSS